MAFDITYFKVSKWPIRLVDLNYRGKLSDSRTS